MCQYFQNFYAFVKETQLDWKTLEGSLKIKERRYPTNQEVQTYFIEIFNQKTANIKRSKWHSMDKILCIWVVAQYCTAINKNMLFLQKMDFKEISRILGINQSLLEFKWLKLIKPYIKNKPWSQAEDELIRQLINNDSQKKWTQVALILSKSNSGNGLRTAKQVRQRWINYIDPSMKRCQWTAKQDQKLLQLVHIHGKKWSILGKQLKRTQNSIKNRFNSLSNRSKQYDYQSKIDFLRNQSSQDSITIFPKVQQFQKFNTINTFILNISHHPIKQQYLSQPKTCGYRELLPEQRI